MRRDGARIGFESCSPAGAEGRFVGGAPSRRVSARLISHKQTECCLHAAALLPPGLAQAYFTACEIRTLARRRTEAGESSAFRFISACDFAESRPRQPVPAGPRRQVTNLAGAVLVQCKLRSQRCSVFRTRPDLPVAPGHRPGEILIDGSSESARCCLSWRLPEEARPRRGPGILALPVGTPPPPGPGLPLAALPSPPRPATRTPALAGTMMGARRRQAGARPGGPGQGSA